MVPFVVMRSHNDMPILAETLAALHRQSSPFVLLVFDNASTDGTREEALRYTDRVVNVPAGTYVPGKVLNSAMQATSGEVVVFLNSDCTPTNTTWLASLLSGLSDPEVAAVFGRQIPRPGCHPLFAKDTEETYGDGARQRFWRHCFSMASSAIRRSVWEPMPFNEAIQYSEDIEWTWRARQKGYRIAYVPESEVLHSHNYTLRQFHKRMFGEGKAEARIFSWSAWESSFLRYSLLPYFRQVLSDLRYCLPRGLLGPACFSWVLRGVQLAGRRKGFVEGLRICSR